VGALRGACRRLYRAALTGEAGVFVCMRYCVPVNNHGLLLHASAIIAMIVERHGCPVSDRCQWHACCNCTINHRLLEFDSTICCCSMWRVICRVCWRHRPSPAAVTGGVPG
jgi:hypothetical protein